MLPAVGIPLVGFLSGCGASDSGEITEPLHWARNELNLEQWVQAKKEKSELICSQRISTSPEIAAMRRTGLDSKIVKEVRDIAMKLPAWRFLLLSTIALLVAAGYLAGNVPWDKVL